MDQLVLGGAKWSKLPDARYRMQQTVPLLWNMTRGGCGGRVAGIMAGADITEREQ